MPLIEGFGDEVTLLLLGLLAAIVVVLAWMSTQVDSSFLVPIIVLDRDRFAALMQRLRGMAEQRFTAGNQASSQSTTYQSVSNEAEQEPSASGENAEVVDAVSPSVEPQTSMSEGESEEEPGPGSHLTERTQDSATAEVGMDSESALAADVCGFNKSQATESEDLLPTPATSHASDNFSRPESSAAPEQQNGAELSAPDDAAFLGAPSGNEENTSAIPEGHIQIRLQYIDGRQRMICVNPDDTMRDFKRNHFAAELASRSIVRFVMSGQELRNDDLTLRSYRVSNGSVIHCLITQSRSEPAVVSLVDSHHFDIGFLMFPLFGFLLMLLWYARIAYRNYFSGASTCSLVAISFLYLVAFIGSFRSNRIHHPHQD